MDTRLDMLVQAPVSPALGRLRQQELKQRWWEVCKVLKSKAKALHKDWTALRSAAVAAYVAIWLTGSGSCCCTGHQSLPHFPPHVHHCQMSSEQTSQGCGRSQKRLGGPSVGGGAPPQNPVAISGGSR
jgi:predicted secreted hydrolase